MNTTLKLTILTPERKIFHGDVKDLIIENGLGRLEILPKHISMITSLVATVTSFTTLDGEKHKLFTSTGMLKVDNDEINMLTETAEWPEEIDVNRAEEARLKAEKLLKESKEMKSDRSHVVL